MLSKKKVIHTNKLLGKEALELTSVLAKVVTGLRLSSNTMTVMVRTDVEEVSHQTIDTSEDDKLGKLRMLTVTILCLLPSFNVLLV